MRIIFLLYFYAIAISINAQPLQPIIEIEQEGSIIPHAMKFFDDELWLSGSNNDFGYGVIWKFDKFGNSIDSLILNDTVTFHEFDTKGDSVIAFGTQYIGGVWQLAIYNISKNFDINWMKTIDLNYRPVIIRFRVFDFNDQKIILLRGTPSHFFRFDANYNLLFEKRDTQPGKVYNSEPIGYTSRGFIFSKNGLNIVELDTLFQDVDTIASQNTGYYGEGGHMLPIGYNYMSSGPIENNLSQIMYIDTTFEVKQKFPLNDAISNKTDPKYTFYRSIAPNSDTSNVFVSGITDYNQTPHIVQLGCKHTNSIWVAYANPDSVKWDRQYADSINYYLTINMALGPDGSLYVAASRYNVLEQPDYTDAVVFRISKEGDFLVGDPNELIQNIGSKVYPNPGKNYLNIHIPNYSESVVYLYDLQGRIVHRSSFKNKTRLNTESLNTGIYFYRITTQKGEIYIGKWVKR